MMPALALLLAFLAGSFPTALLMGRAKGIDLRRQGSGNIGATNAFRVLGKAWGIACLLMDAAKGLAPATLLAGDAWLPGALAPKTWMLIVGLAAIAGHMFSPWVGFKGGKGVATSLGVFLAIAPAALGVCLALGILIIATTGYVSLASIVGAALLPILIFAFAPPDDRPWTVIVIAASLGVFVIWKHRANIRRLMGGSENRIFPTAKAGEK
jgi:glycerol-3-phosphate acyltransferase PlsY